MYIVFLLPAHFSSYTIRLPHSHFAASFANYYLFSLPCSFNFALFKLEFNSNIFQCFSFPTQLSILLTYKLMPFSSNFRFLSCFRVPFSLRNFIYIYVFSFLYLLFSEMVGFCRIVSFFSFSSLLFAVLLCFDRAAVE